MYRSELKGKLAIALAAAVMTTTLGMAGPLEPPPGPVTSTGRFGPRIDVATLPGDATTLRVISQPGSYYLSDNLIGQSGKAGIRITVNDVTLDLNGYTLDGRPGSTDGIVINAQGVKISNGNVISWVNGVSSASNAGHARFREISVRASSGRGIFLPTSVHVHVMDCSVMGSGNDGIVLGDDAQIVRTFASNNGGDGIEVVDNASILDSKATYNVLTGITCVSGLVRGNMMRNNGIDINPGVCKVIENQP